MDIDRFQALADAMVERLPPRLLEGLTGGIVVEERPYRRRGDPEGVYILGEYIPDPWLGPRVVIYYGSFARLFAGQDDAVWERELWTTLTHELRHHIEHQAGVRDLELEDALELERMRQTEEEARWLDRIKRVRRRLRRGR